MSPLKFEKVLAAWLTLNSVKGFTINAKPLEDLTCASSAKVSMKKQDELFTNFSQ